MAKEEEQDVGRSPALHHLSAPEAFHTKFPPGIMVERDGGHLVYR